MTIRGSVDLVSGTEIRGWAFAPGRRDPVVVQAVLNHEILGETVADLHRPDLAAAGLGDGRSGYQLRLFREIDRLYLPFIVVKVDGGDAELPRAPMLGFGEFFAALHAAHPAAGRHRSVFGGLWTSRTDAAGLLRGKADIGQISAESGTMISHLITGGFCQVTLRKRPGNDPDLADLHEQVAGVLEDTTLLKLLRAVLEDNPIVVQARHLRDCATEFGQPSARNRSPSPAECLDIVIPVAGEALLDVVRDCDRIPEFTPRGASRWVSGLPGDGVELAAGSGLLDRHVLTPGEAAVIGAGTLYRCQSAPRASVLQALCCPSRSLPLALALTGGLQETVRASGVRIFA